MVLLSFAMSEKQTIMKNIGRRLREERQRRGETVEEFSEASGLHPTSVGNYERGERAPNAALLIIWHDIGIDIGYVLTGVRWGARVNQYEQELIDRYGRLSADEQVIVSALLANMVGEKADLAEMTASAKKPSLHDKAIKYVARPLED
jgi:transcriptional regulator with XRE-family HTH domain